VGAAAIAARLRENVGKVIIGKEGVIDLILVALACEGHILLEDVPGTGKTMLAKTVSRSLQLEFRRVQFTPDLLPSDVTGVSVFNEATAQFEFRKGPAFTNVLLADEINRATPRTQAALLECMEERQVTTDGETRPLADPFIVLATQNPIEQEGTFPLPEAQLDRFLLRLSLGYPSPQEEARLLTRFAATNPLHALQPVAGAVDVVAMRTAAQAVLLGEAVSAYIVAIVRATREHEALRLGASPRATLALMRAARARAALLGRAFVMPDDVKELVKPVLSHRLILKNQYRLRGQSQESVLDSVLGQIPVPVLPDTYQ
jgi:MoxR-like ATPase